jgi:hypothetical protein
MAETIWSEKEGRDVIRAWRRSALTMSAFARSRGLNVQRVRYWRERVEGGTRGEAANIANARTPKLVPGVVVDMRSGGGVSVVLPHGVVVEARRLAEIDPVWLAQVVRALEE